ncbi:MAG: hypothetical protein JWL90_2759, partial [Chthoniobacteraceae bacterium]|nr:hypothetical protein [Chthoniobacteraceae bacterium]
NFDDVSDLFGSRETIVINEPEPGNWYLLASGTSAFTNVTLTARYKRGSNSKPVPRLIPAPGSYPEQVTVKLRCTVPRSVLHYTTDGSDPDEASPVYNRPLILSADTGLRVRANLPGKPPGPVVEASYFIRPAGSVHTLLSGLAFTHLAGTQGRTQLFKINVPPGQLRLDLLSQGGSGNSDFYVRHGALPTAKLFDYPAKGSRDQKEVTVMNPEAGDWFILLRARTSFARCALMASYTGVKPDLVVWTNALEPYLSVETFRPDDCEVEEGLISAGAHTLLRFTTESRNVGGSDLVMPPILNPDGSVNPIYEYHACHDHYHFLSFASYRLLDARNQPVASGRKVSFCLEDVQPWSLRASPGVKYDCEMQGIQTGWSDVYDAGLPGQWIDVTNVPLGNYTLEVTVNPEAIIDEEDYLNNTVTIPVQIVAP